MKIVRKKEAKKFQNSAVCAAYEYDLGDNDINGAVIELKGRYPDKGRAVNTKCKELVYVMSGSGKLEVEGRSFDISEGDQVLINPGEKYFFDGACTLFVPCTPAWNPEQYKEVE